MILRLQVLCAELLLPIYQEELRLIDMDHIARHRELDVRATCGTSVTHACDANLTTSDICETELFGGSWLCSVCAHEYCIACVSLAREFKVHHRK